MTSADYHEQCGSHVRISLKDLNGPFAYILAEQYHPATALYPNVSVATCELAAGHPSRCEMFVDGTGAQNDEPYRGHWLTWTRPASKTELPTDYEWIISPECCQAQSTNGWHCSRPADHDGGHVFTSS